MFWVLSTMKTEEEVMHVFFLYYIVLTLLGYSKALREFLKHRPSGPMLSLSRNVRLSVRLSACLSVCPSVHF